MAKLFSKSSEAVRSIYDAILMEARTFGPVKVEEKQTSIHLVAGSAFAGIHPRKDAILLNIRTTRPIKSKRIRKSEQVSANRCHNELLVGGTGEVNAELIGWLREAYDLGGK